GWWRRGRARIWRRWPWRWRWRRTWPRRWWRGRTLLSDDNFYLNRTVALIVPPGNPRYSTVTVWLDLAGNTFIEPRLSTSPDFSFFPERPRSSTSQSTAFSGWLKMALPFAWPRSAPV